MHTRTLLFTAVWMPIVFCLGCGEPMAQVTGRITLADQTPLVGATVTLEDATLRRRASGITNTDGRFRVSTNAPDDGALLGVYQVTVHQAGPEDSSQPEPPRLFHPKYERASTSGLECDVKAGGTTLDLVLDKP